MKEVTTELIKDLFPELVFNVVDFKTQERFTLDENNEWVAIDPVFFVDLRIESGLNLQDNIEKTICEISGLDYTLNNI